MDDPARPSYSWELKKKVSEISKPIWSILKLVPGYLNISKRWLLYLYQNMYIATHRDQGGLFNKGLKSI